MTEEEEQIQKQLDEARKIKEREDKQKEMNFTMNQKYEMKYVNDKWVLTLKEPDGKGETRVYAAGAWRKYNGR